MPAKSPGKRLRTRPLRPMYGTMKRPGDGVGAWPLENPRWICGLVENLW